MANHLIKRLLTRRATDMFGRPYQKTCPFCNSPAVVRHNPSPSTTPYEYVEYQCGTTFTYNKGIQVHVQHGLFCVEDDILSEED